MVRKANEDLAKWEESRGLLIPGEDWVKEEQMEIVFKAGTSKRIWNELYKVRGRCQGFLLDSKSQLSVLFHNKKFASL